ncbi:expressed unknown protein [Seminavis robusta]|uniref:Uncharacterized protein n=1 Tax=Seminavis robusta TaxID=568900 RepID=A0A9N8EEW2_9STRA|nr:expressed unknown protein [Seminavis robusta]|eukprot:Sro891_g216860.1 n/a (305) ;mRNA; r:36364-37351
MEKSVPELVGRQWRQDLAEESAWAFSCGVAALLSNTFKVPMDDILLRHGETGEIVFAYTTPFTRESISQTEEQAATGKDGQSKQAADSLNAEETSEEESTDQKSSTINQTQSSYYFDDVEEVFEEDVIELYRSFHKKFHEATRLSSNEQTPAPLEITLTLTPVDAELHKIFCFPFLSRSAVKEDKSRKKDYMTMLESIRHEGAQSFFKAFWAFADRMLAERGMMQTTVMADVMIECTESFQVKDVSTNEILQGDGIERTVRHCVRMERDSSLVQEDNQEFWVQGNWKIADIDDHLVGRGLWTPI